MVHSGYQRLVYVPYDGETEIERVWKVRGDKSSERKKAENSKKYKRRVDVNHGLWSRLGTRPKRPTERPGSRWEICLASMSGTVHRVPLPPPTVPPENLPAAQSLPTRERGGFSPSVERRYRRAERRAISRRLHRVNKHLDGGGVERANDVMGANHSRNGSDLSEEGNEYFPRQRLEVCSIKVQ
ncbi:unnamed protein product [Nesidiocoris tenuis]|uniref:Uncharacterized protein n=1 Tax=Nesidiocoris tenuis TaxID=355587 RepID=A0A6H5H558_9HEMI|nr:unnamed protein product [Nesidiocoris tenuis]